MPGISAVIKTLKFIWKPNRSLLKLHDWEGQFHHSDHISRDTGTYCLLLCLDLYLAFSVLVFDPEFLIFLPIFTKCFEVWLVFWPSEESRESTGKQTTTSPRKKKNSETAWSVFKLRSNSDIHASWWIKSKFQQQKIVRNQEKWVFMRRFHCIICIR